MKYQDDINWLGKILLAGYLFGATFIACEYNKALEAVKNAGEVSCSQLNNLASFSQSSLEEIRRSNQESLNLQRNGLMGECKDHFSGMKYYCKQETDSLLDRECFVLLEYDEQGFQYSFNPYQLGTSTKHTLEAKLVNPDSFFPENNEVKYVDLDNH